MPTLTIEPDKIGYLVDQLDIKDKTKIFERIKSQVNSSKWDALFARIDQRIKDRPLSEKEINEEIENAREEIAACRS